LAASGKMLAVGGLYDHRSMAVIHSTPARAIITHAISVSNEQQSCIRKGASNQQNIPLIATPGRATAIYLFVGACRHAYAVRQIEDLQVCSVACGSMPPGSMPPLRTRHACWCRLSRETWTKLLRPLFARGCKALPSTQAQRSLRSGEELRPLRSSDVCRRPPG
jgi:hypothetical protein